MKFQFNDRKAVAAILHIANELISCGQKVGFHKLFKILYFAEKEHIATWGRPITGDDFIAMEDGPVPSKIYDILKSIRGEKILFINPSDFEQFFEVSGYLVFPKLPANMDELSLSDIECIDRSVEENAHLSYGTLCDKSHGSAWSETTPNTEMPVEGIAKEAGANSQMIEYIRLNAENSNLLG